MAFSRRTARTRNSHKKTQASERPLCPYMYSIAFCHFNLVFLFPGDAVRPIALNFAWTERHCHACKTPRNMYPSICNCFPVIRTTIAKNRNFYVPRPSFFVCPGDALATITQYVAWMERQFNACQTPRSMYLSIFNSFRVIRYLSQCVSPKIAIFTTFWFPLRTPLGQSR